MHVPDMLDDAAAGAHLALVAKQEFEQRELLRSEGESGRAISRLVGRRIDRQQSGGERAAFAAAPPELHPDAGKQLLEFERFANVVVGPRIESEHHVFDGVLRRQEDDRSLDALLAELPAHLDTADAGNHPVNKEQIVVAGQRQFEPLAAIAGDVDREVLLLQSLFEESRDSRFIFDNEDSHPCCGLMVIIVAVAFRLVADQTAEQFRSLLAIGRRDLGDGLRWRVHRDAVVFELGDHFVRALFGDQRDGFDGRSFERFCRCSGDMLVVFFLSVAEEGHCRGHRDNRA